MKQDVASALFKQSEKRIHFYRNVVRLLNEAKVDYLVGGAYAYYFYSGIARQTKDFDLFIRREDYDRIADILRDAGFHTELSYPHWLGKAFLGDDFIDLIFSGGNGVAEVDDGWFTRSVAAEFFGLPIQMTPVEEMIWSKAFIMERERYDGADVAHLLLTCAETMDWDLLVARFGDHWRVLFAHLTMFGFIYPSDRSKIPVAVLQEMISRMRRESIDDVEKVCHGPLISRSQYLVDVDHLGYEDGRLEPRGNMTADQIEHWTAAIPED
jgi:hypothetical protein